MTARTVAFVDHGSTQQSGHDGGPRLVAAADAARTGLGQLASGAAADRVFIGVFAGTQRTGGYSVRVEKIERERDRLVVHARFVAPSPGMLTIQVITSPAQLVSIAASDASGVREAVLVDETGTERDRTSLSARGP